MAVQRFQGSEVRPFRWAEFVQEESRPRPEAPAAEPAPAPAAPTPDELLAAARLQAEELVAAARADVEELREAARREGYDRGVAEGRTAIAEAVARWEALAGELAAYKPHLFEEARANLVELCLAVVEKILGPLAETDSETVVRVAGHALQALSDREVLTIRVNPADLQGLLEAKPRLLQTFDGIKKLTVLEDPSVGRGGCLVETPTAEIDARLDSQFRELVRSLKKP